MLDVMSSPRQTLHLICGKIGSGKSTLAARLGREPATVIISEDEWLSALFGDEMSTIADYVRCSEKLKSIMGSHVVSLLEAGNSVVLDFAANTVSQRNWMRSILESSGVHHELHYLDVPDEICKARLKARNAAGEHPFAPTDEQYEQITRYFTPPSPDEGFQVVRYRVKE